MTDITVALEKIKIAMSAEFLREMLIEPEFRIHEIIPGHFRAELRGFLYGENLPEREVTKYPADWWQAVKEKWFPRWALKRWPVVYKRVFVSGDIVYPDIRASLPGRKHKYILRVLNEPVTTIPRKGDDE